MSSNIYVYKMGVVPPKKIKAVERVLGTKLPPDTYIKSEVYQSKTKWLDIGARSYSLGDMEKAIETAQGDEGEKKRLLEAIARASVRSDEWLVVEIDYDY